VAGLPGDQPDGAEREVGRTGGWAVLRYVGTDGYRSLALAARAALLSLVRGVEDVDGLRVLGVPDSTLLAVAGSDVDVFVVADELRARGFYAQVQPGLGPVPRTCTSPRTASARPQWTRWSPRWASAVIRCSGVANNGCPDLTRSVYRYGWSALRRVVRLVRRV
jgi:hypothetical protein